MIDELLSPEIHLTRITPMRRRTRIVATLGPATDTPEMMRAIIEAGVDVVRINFSHGTEEEHLARINRLRETARSVGKYVAVLADLPGPKLRVKITEARKLEIGGELSFAAQKTPIQPQDLTITEPEMLLDVKVGNRILLDDGRLQAETIRCEGNRVIAKITVGGNLLPNKGVNLPDTPLTIPALTDRDRQAIAIAAQAKVDWLALSFVRNPEAATELRDEAHKHGLKVPLLAKMERPEADVNAESIIMAFDGIMVARGDLGVEIPLERVPTVQKKLIALARRAGKPVITATDMLDSMRQNPRPTRAEAGDVANAIYDGTDAVMLSGETAVGTYPVESVACMHRIAVEAEAHLHQIDHPMQLQLKDPSVDDHITEVVVELAEKLKVDAIITPTLSGRTARLMARHRPGVKIIAPAPSESILAQMALIWGLVPALMEDCHAAGTDRLSGAVLAAFKAKAVSEGQRAIVLAGHPSEGGPYLPTIRFVRIGKDGQAVDPE
jgi:pyruvate kinase